MLNKIPAPQVKYFLTKTLNLIMKRQILTLLTGMLLFLPVTQAQMARVQAIHNCPDTGADTVDVWLNDVLLIDNFAYKTASPYIDAPAGVSFDLSIAAKNSTDTVGAIFKKSFTLPMNSTNVVVASGGLAETGATAFDLRAYGGQEEAANQGAGEISLNVIHGSYDAPEVDIFEVQIPAGELVPDLEFGEDVGSYVNLGATDYDIQVRTQSGIVAAEFDADLSTLADSAAIVLATGFLDPSMAAGTEPFGLIAVLPNGAVVELPTKSITPARLQVIHNCPDMLAGTVDVWLNDVLLLDNFNYKEATPYIDAPAGANFDVSIAVPTSTDTVGALFRKSFLLPSNSTSVVVASGGLAETGATAFDLRAYGGQEEAANQGAGEISLNVIHGSYDAPEVDIFEVQIPAGELVPDLEFGEDVGSYVNLGATDYDIQVRTQSGIVAAEFDADLSTLADSAAIVLATGFLDPSMAAGTEPFGLIAVLPNGAVVELPTKSITPALLQVIHNCPDMLAGTVDVWLNDVLLLDNFNYKEATPYIDAPAGANFDVSIAVPTSTDTVGALFRKSFLLPSNSTSVVVASGGLAETGATAFDLRAYGGQEEAANQGAGEISLNVIHGSYDAPEVDIFEVQIPAGELVPDLEFGEDIGSYVDLGATDYDIQVRTQSGIVAAEFDANLSTLADSAAIVLATGFLDPSMAAGTEPFGLIAVLPNGTVIQLPAKSITVARLQVIHNCAAIDADTVDIWLNDTALLDDFAFRTASPFIDAPAGTNFDVSVALPNSTDTTGALFRQTFLLESGKTYIVVASGTVGSGTYTPATPFSLEVITDAREKADTAGKVDVLVWHGATDAPTVDVAETQVGAGTIVDDISYGEAQGYLSLAAADYDLEIQNMAGDTALFAYDADLSALGDSAITVLASGFVDTTANNGGAAFGLWVALASGGNLIELPSLTVGLEDIGFINQLKLFPNPARDVITIELESTESNELTYEVLNMFGSVMMNQQARVLPGENNYTFDLGKLPNGYYFIRIRSEAQAQVLPFLKR